LNRQFGAADLTYFARIEKYQYGNRATDVAFQNKQWTNFTKAHEICHAGRI